jgi:hypothetical protein
MYFSRPMNPSRLANLSRAAWGDRYVWGPDLLVRDSEGMMHAAMVVGHSIDRGVTLDQNEAEASRIEEHHLPVRRGRQMPAADDFRIEPHASYDVAHGNANAEMSHASDCNHLTSPCANGLATQIE